MPAAVHVTPANLALLSLIICAATPPLMAALLFACFRLLCGTLYPAYRSYKAVRTKNVKEYVKWMMYWIVFALFTVAETFSDVVLAFWFPFYYEIKIILVVWLLSPITQGSSILYRKFVHPQLERREAEIDEYLARAKEKGYSTVFQLGLGGISLAKEFLAKTALQGGGNIIDQLRRSYSMTHLAAPALEESPRQRTRAVTLTEADEMDVGLQMAPLRDNSPQGRHNNNFDDSDSDAGGSPTQSSGYGSVANPVKVEPMEVEPLPRTRSKAKTGAGVTRKKVATNEDFSANTLPRTKKTVRKKIPKFDQ